MSRRLAAALGACLLLIVSGSASVAAPADSTSAEPAITAPALPDTTEPSGSIDALRKRGRTDLEEVLRGRQAALLLPAPRFGPISAPTVLPDAGTRIRPWPLGVLAERSTDRTLVAGFPFGLAIPDLVIAWDDPQGDGFEIQEFRAFDRGVAPASFRGAGDLLATPRAESFHDFAMPGAAAGPRRVQSALSYRKGDGDALDTGARFASPLLARGVAFSYARHASDGLLPFLSHLSTQYMAAAGLPRIGGLSLWLEGARFQRTIEMDIPSGYAANVGAEIARGEWGAEEIALHARTGQAALRGAGAIRLGRATRTQVDYARGRERWAFPQAALTASVTRDLGAGGWTWNGSLDVDSRQVRYRVDSLPAFDPRFESVRVSAGVGRALFSGIHVGLAAAFDARERDRPFADGRLSLWGSGPRGEARIDFESAHERPSWVDRLTPARDSLLLFAGPAGETIRVFRSGDPSLRARSLRGALANGRLQIARGVSILGSGSLRRLSDDFGWDVTRTQTPDSIVILDVARARGDGWVSMAGVGLVLDRAWVRAHGMAWARGGPDRLSPRAGSPPRQGLDAALALRAKLFGGDLPLELGAEAHAQGPRRGIIRAPATVGWDGALRADFGAAAIFFQFSNIFDRRVPSALYEISTDAAVLLPRRTFHFGVVWHLMD